MANSTLRDKDISAAVNLAAAKLGYPVVQNEHCAILKAFLKGSDVFVSLSTDFDKSLCYSVLPDVFDTLHGVRGDTPKSTALVVSPDIALMKDQVRLLERRGVRAVFYGEADEDTRGCITEGRYQLVFMTPESLLTDEEWEDTLSCSHYQEHLIGVAVDQTHCVKKWGVTFRAEFDSILDLRNLLPEGVNMMALTSLATKSTRDDVCELLGMINPVIFSHIPSKKNLKYLVIKKGYSLEDTFAPLVEELRRKRQQMDRVIIFCREIMTCADIYSFLRLRLGDQHTEPVGAPSLSCFRLIEMFHTCCTKGLKDAILAQFSRESPLRVVVTTTEFGMALDCPDLRRIIHWDPPSDTETYIKETGLAGRDSLSCEAVLYYTGRDLRGTRIARSFKGYCTNEVECRRQLLLKDFDGVNLHQDVVLSKCQCCDVCGRTCMCTICS